MVLEESEGLVDNVTSAREKANLNVKVEPNLLNEANNMSNGSPTYQFLDDTEISTKLEMVDLSGNLSLFQSQQEDSSAGALLSTVATSQ